MSRQRYVIEKGIATRHRPWTLLKTGESVIVVSDYGSWAVTAEDLLLAIYTGAVPYEHAQEFAQEDRYRVWLDE